MTALGSAHIDTSSRRRLLWACATLLGAASSLSAQGVTGAAIEGRVLARDSTPVQQAIVEVTNSATGQRWRTATDPRGRYFIEYLSVGGPYRVAVQAIGYRPVEREPLFVALGQRVAVDFTLSTAEVELQEIVVTAVDSSLSAGARTGPSRIVAGGTIDRLPVKGRDYTSLAVLAPQVTVSPNGALSFAGQHDRFNSVQIDGTSNTDPFGRARTGNGPPGYAVGLTAFTPEAVQELQIVTAPFDIRYGGFAGGLINAVTRSGSNQVEGSIRGLYQSSGLTGNDSAGHRASGFTDRQLELTLGAPIVRDRVALFLNAASTREASPQTVPAPTPADTATGTLRYESAVRFRDLLHGYGVEPGEFAAGSYSTPSWNLFLKVTAQPGLNSHLTVSHNYGHGNDRRAIGERVDPGFYGFSSSGTLNPETINVTRLEWTTAPRARLSNQLLLARVDDRRTCVPSSDLPAVSLVADETTELFAGSSASCSGLETGHTLWQLTDNIGLRAGSHRLIFGVHGERADLVDDVLPFPRGVWSFDGLDSLAQGTPSRYVRDLSTGPDSRVAFRVSEVSAYGQDQWSPTPRLVLTGGLRLDVPYVRTPPARNATADSALDINTSLTPSGNVLWSPRLGVNYGPTGRGKTVLRGGVGYFAGSPPYVWFRNVYGTAGIRSLRLDCQGDELPAFTLDPAHQPTTCRTPSPLASPLAYFDPRFRFPQSLKVAFGVDHRLPSGVVGTVDLLYTRLVNSVETEDVNLRGPLGTAAGEGGRTLYGTIDEATGRATPGRVSHALRGVFPLRNGGGDRSYSLTAQLNKTFSGGTELSVGYTYTDAKDRMSLVADMGGVNASSTPVEGTLEQRALRTSIWGRPHKLTVVGTADLPYGFRLGITWIGMSGAPYTYVAEGDPNADGFRFEDVSNDVVYVPREAADITLANPDEFAALDSVIRSERCLRDQRGRLLERNSCRDPWENETTARLSKLAHLANRRTVEVTVDLFNVLNFVDGDWGLVRQTVSDVGNAVRLLRLVGYDTPNSRGVYEFIPVARRQIEVDASRWRLQLGVTLSY